MYRNDKRNGYGILTYADGTKFEGNFIKDKRSGKGLWVDVDGSKREVIFANCRCK
ncbi:MULTISPECIES: hypothetical protein [Parachlamydia]|jgi:hypothetical protein|uniref:hypothetical protein n=1 Tax=Parachlamydia TaxID=83551 RepID=UPI0001C17794|nr:hypothetical protein pah_c198o019 [Parachlamydia acanthamoebae str. Hall's coccus]